ncbi:MAG: di-heme oxidoredictase family protein [Burkholderiales bacterium]
MRKAAGWIGGLAMLSLAAVVPAALDRLPEAALSAGDLTVAVFDERAFSEHPSWLDRKQRQSFAVGRNIFHRQWAAVISLNGDWGLGPTFIADRCSACHVNTGRGAPPASGDAQPQSLLVRISLPGSSAHGGPNPHPHYGAQLQNRSLDGTHIDLAYSGEPVPAEAELYLDWEERTVAFADGETVSLRKPRLRIENANFGPLGPEAMFSLRNAQPIFGLGLLEAVSEADVLAIAARQKASGFDGRPNYVWDMLNRRVTLGRFGWKANEPNLRQQVAVAAIEDMGLSSRLFPDQNCPPAQEVCVRQLPGNVPELLMHEIEMLEFWLRTLGVPARRNIDEPQFRRGERLFAEAQCAVCHVPELRTAAQFPALPQLANQTIRAYTDLLLHDMGEELADGRPDYRAGPRDWRTPPLWGIGLTQTVSGSVALLHDGRARSITEAILWHGGEAEASREAFGNMPKADREALLFFLGSI